MTAALIWLVGGVALIVGEVLSGDLVLLMLGIGGLFGAAAAGLTDNPYVQVAVFGVASIGLLVLARPALKRRFLAGSEVKMNAEALVGVSALVLSTVDLHEGQVKVGGDVWSARSFTEDQVIEPGTTVTVVEISGATAVVSNEP